MFPNRDRSILFLLCVLVVILPQCSDKNSAEYYREGRAFIEAQDYQGAKDAFQKSIDKDPKNPDGYYGLGGIHNYNKEYDLAEKAFKSALRIDPTYVDAHYSLGYTYEQQGKKEAADKEYQIYHRLKKKMDRYLKEDKESR